jgi:3-oxoacyl-[acyl-carrier-protein] synthase-1
MTGPVTILSTGLVTSVGLSAPAACAAIRAKIANPSPTRFLGSSGEWIGAHQVRLPMPWRGKAKLAKMAAMAIRECMDATQEDFARIPMLLCTAERDRPGRLEGLDDDLFGSVQRELGVEFSAESLTVPQGRVSFAVALKHARQLIGETGVSRVLIVAADSLLNWPSLEVYDRDSRLLTPENSNGFVPGEAAGALLVGPAVAGRHLQCTGLGFAMEPAHINSEAPLRGDGLSQAIRGALADAGCAMSDLQFRITDLSGEHYYFKEAALGFARIVRMRKEDFDLWHPAECIGESGAVAGIAAIAVAFAASHKEYAPGPGILCHAANDNGQRAAAIVRFGMS